MTDKEELSFEKAMEQLETIVAKLEEGDASLEHTIELFQEGMKLSQLCGEKLQQVERKVEQLLEQDGQIKTESFAQETD